MTARQSELAHLASRLCWLPDEAAQREFSRASEATSKERYGLDERVWEIIERWDVEQVGEAASRSRLSHHAVDPEVVVYFGSHDVCRMARDTFLAHWQDMLMPSRDDVLIMPASGAWCLFYCHEDEFEAARRKRKQNQSLDTNALHGQ